MTTTQRNFLILGLIAVAGLFAQEQFSLGAGALSGLLNLAFMVLIVWFLVNLYLRNTGTIGQMAPTPRLVMQASAATLLFLLVVGMFPAVLPIVGVRMPPPIGFSQYGGSWTLLFFGGLFAAGFGAWWAWQQRTSRW